MFKKIQRLATLMAGVVLCSCGSEKSENDVPTDIAQPLAVVNDVNPTLECVQHLDGGLYRAHFGYNNSSTEKVHAAVGESNRFHPQDWDRGQPDVYLPGRNRFMFAVLFDGTPLTWKLGDATATASSNLVQRCGPDVDGAADVHEMPKSRGHVSVAPSAGETAASTTMSATPVTFTLPDEFSSSGGIIGTGTVKLTVENRKGKAIDCTYRGKSATDTPETPYQLNLARELQFVSCSDGKSASTPRTATKFTLSASNPTQVAATVTLPLDDEGCEQVLRLLSPSQTRQMREEFDWADATKVETENPDGTPALYYAWIYIRNREERAALSKLYIHAQTRPLFNEELDKFGGKCGTFENSGDGEGMFVNALIPGQTYNRLIDTLTHDDIRGDRTIFDAVILRDPPASARNENGSVRLDVLGGVEFKYMGSDTLPDPASIELGSDPGGDLLSAFEFVANVAYEAGELITETLGAIDSWITGKVSVDLNVWGLNLDRNFDESEAMVWAWGSNAGEPLGAPGIEVSILQKLPVIPIPTSFEEQTNSLGHVRLRVAKTDRGRGSGICVRLRTRGASVSDFLLANEMCDFRAYSDVTNRLVKRELSDFTRDRMLDLRIANYQLNALLQMDDAYRYSTKVIGHKPKRARVLTGYWANTFSQNKEGGGKRAAALCLNFRNTLKDELIGAATVLAAQAASIFGPGAGAIAGIGVSAFATVVANSDIIVPPDSDFRESREVGSHEYAHYLLCSLMQEENPFAVDFVAWSTIVNSIIDAPKDPAPDDLERPIRYLNEAFADFITGQVVSAADYNWLRRERTITPNLRFPGYLFADQVNNPGYSSNFCVEEIFEEDPSTGLPTGRSQRKPCFDHNLGPANLDLHHDLGRVATLLHDAFDGHSPSKGQDVTPTNADAWEQDPATLLLSYTGTEYGDASDENVALPGHQIETFARRVARGLTPPATEYSIQAIAEFFSIGAAPDLFPNFDDLKFYSALNVAMVQEEINWCDRCEVFALHSQTNPANVRQQFEACDSGDDLIRSALLAGLPPRGIVLPQSDVPEPDLRINAATCAPCPDGQFSDDNGVCQVCDRTLVGNDCISCVPDVVLDGSSSPLSLEVTTNQSVAGDNCPDEFWLEIQDSQAFLGRGGTRLTIGLTTSPPPSSCEQPHSLTFARPAPGSGTPPTAFDNQLTVTQTGNYPGCTLGVFPCLASCENLPVIERSAAQLGSDPIRFGTARHTNVVMFLSLNAPPGPRE